MSVSGFTWIIKLLITSMSAQRHVLHLHQGPQAACGRTRTQQWPKLCQGPRPGLAAAMASPLCLWEPLPRGPSWTALAPGPGSQTPGSHEANMCFLLQITLQRSRHSVDSENVTDNGFFQSYLTRASNIDYHCKVKMLYPKGTHVNVLLNVVNILKHVLLNRLFLWYWWNVILTLLLSVYTCDLRASYKKWWH